MVFKCCVINCRTNYDTQTKKYPVFTFPSQPDLRNQWLEKIYTKSAKITNSSRVCVRHFNPEDIKRSNKHRTILLPNSVPVGSEHVIESESESEIEDVEEYNLEIVENESIIEEIGLTFEEFTTFVEEKQELVVENWNIYKHPSAFCFYKLSKYDEYLNDFSISFKIIVTSNMNVKICRGETEANSKELLWVLPETTLHSWDQFEDILNFYHQEPEIISKSQFLKHLTTAFKCLGQVKTDEVQDNIESLKVQLYSVLENAEQLEALMEADVKNEENVEKSVYVEALEEVPQQIIDDGTHYDEPMEGMEDIVVDAPQKSPKPEEVIHYKCQNCSLVFISDDNFKAHVINCGVLQESTSTISPVRKHQKKTHKENFDESLKSSKKFGVKREIKFYAW